MINPDGVPYQVEGSILQTVSRTLFEEATFDRNRVTSVDWASYPILTFPDAPVLEIDLMGRPAISRWGAGEAAGLRPSRRDRQRGVRRRRRAVRTVPFTPERVKEALKAVDAKRA